MHSGHHVPWRKYNSVCFGPRCACTVVFRPSAVSATISGKGVPICSGSDIFFHSAFLRYPQIISAALALSDLATAPQPPRRSPDIVTCMGQKRDFHRCHKFLTSIWQGLLSDSVPPSLRHLGRQRWAPKDGPGLTSLTRP